ncbi:hypothetical protein EDB85DRAFT_1917793 [Lactarius pseudohatsudake]|nr:hypothetical protein EDB85DRAFT_1917793 [Lactarius pseudohatsudake]
MLFPLLGLVYFLVFSPRAVLSVFQRISYSPIQQCGPFNISFAGGTPPTALPLTLTVLPFNSTPLVFTIPQSAWDTSTASGSYVAFLPFKEGVSLMASLDDASGKSAALTSGVIQIDTSDNTSCISTATNTTTPSTFQLLGGTVSQCSPFSVARISSSLDYPISVRVFVPTGLSSTLQSTSFYSNQGVDIFTFVMNVARGFQVALLFDDGQETPQVSGLLSVAGGASNPTQCLQITSTTSTATASASSLSRSAVIAISVTSSVIVVIILVLGIFFIRRERRKLAALRGDPIGAVQNHDQFGEPGPMFNPPRPSRNPPIFPMARAPANPVDPPMSSPRSSVFSPFVPSSPGFWRSRSNSSRNPSIRTKSSIGGSNSRPLVDLDIAELLEVASVTHRAETETQSNSSRGFPASTLAVPPSSLAPLLKSHRFSSGRKRRHQDLDVPLSPLRRSSSFSLATRGPSALAQDTKAATPQNGDLSSQGTSSTSSRNVGVRSRSKNPTRF